MAAGGEFVEGWLVAQVLGEGAYGEVRLLVHARSGAAVALKVARGQAGGGAREAALHRALRHRHVLRCLGERAHQGHHYLFLEYAQGGELFDRIEPDVGMPEGVARRYWQQLLAGLGYLHARGVAHRDIKPENLLLDHRDDLKISDFGMATLFRHEARERLLARVCGTAPYAAPEVLRANEQPYRAAPADLWAAALVLFAMLTGELPWERADERDVRYAAWRTGTTPGAWRKLSAGALALLRRALRAEPQRRAALPALQEHPWTLAGDSEWRKSRSRLVPQHGVLPAGRCSAWRRVTEEWLDAALWRFSSVTCEMLIKLDYQSTASTAQLRAADTRLAGSDRTQFATLCPFELRTAARVRGSNDDDGAESGERAWRSQPAEGAAGAPLSAADMDALLCYSQPTHADDLLLSTPADAPPAGVLQRLVRRMTRVWVRGDAAAALGALAAAAARRGHVCRRLHERLMCIECGEELRMRAWARHVDDDARTLLEFRRSRGCGLQFKRRYVELRDDLAPLAAPAPPSPTARADVDML